MSLCWLRGGVYQAGALCSTDAHRLTLLRCVHRLVASRQCCQGALHQCASQQGAECCGRLTSSLAFRLRDAVGMQEVCIKTQFAGAGRCALRLPGQQFCLRLLDAAGLQAPSNNTPLEGGQCSARCGRLAGHITRRGVLALPHCGSLASSFPANPGQGGGRICLTEAELGPALCEL